MFPQLSAARARCVVRVWFACLTTEVTQGRQAALRSRLHLWHCRQLPLLLRRTDADARAPSLLLLLLLLQSHAPPDSDKMESRSRRVLWISGLEESATADLVRAACVPFGDLVDVSLPLDMATGRHRGFAFVEFEEEADAREALDNLHGAELLGRALRVTVARPQREAGAAKAVWSSEEWLKALAAGPQDADAAAGAADADGGDAGEAAR